MGCHDTKWHLYLIYCLLFFSSGNFEQYREYHKLWKNIDFIVVIIAQVLVRIFQQGNEEKLSKKWQQLLSRERTSYKLGQAMQDQSSLHA